MTYETHNVASEQKDPNSILNFYKNLLALRHTNKALLDGDYVALNQDDANVYSYLRRYKGQAVLVVLNMSENPQNVSFDLIETGIQHGRGQDVAEHDQWRRDPETVGDFAAAVHGLHRRSDEVTVERESDLVRRLYFGDDEVLRRLTGLAATMLAATLLQAASGPEGLSPAPARSGESSSSTAKVRRSSRPCGQGGQSV